LSCEGKAYAPCLQTILEASKENFPNSVKELMKAAASFSKEALFLRDHTLADVPDDEHHSLPNGCTLEQLAIQGWPNLPPGKKYVVNADLFELLTPENQVGLVLHEILQAERQTGVGQSTPDVRRVVMGYLSGDVAKLTEQQFCEFYSEYKKTWCSVRRGKLEWKTQNENFMAVGHTKLDWREGRLTRVRNDRGTVGFIARGDRTLDTNWSYEEMHVDISLTEDSLVFRVPALLELRTRDLKKSFGSFRGITLVDQEQICARSFEPSSGSKPPKTANGCWKWDQF